MTVASAANKVTQNGNGATTSWPFSFRIFDSSDLEIYKTDASGVQTEITSNFSVVVNGESGGTVTYPNTGSPLASGEKITIIRVTVRAQSVDFTSQGAFLPQNHEDADDRAMMILQELDEKIDRAFKLPTSDTSNTATELTTDVAGSAGGVLYIQAGVLKLSEAANIDNLETLAGISGDITTVAANDANITTVAADLTGADTIGTVAASIANVNSVGGNISNVIAVDGNAANINAAVANATNINTVAGISTNVTTVAGISADVAAVAADAADIGVVSSNIADINTVAGISANVATVAGDAAAINTVATDLTGDDDIGTVAASISNVDAVGSNITDITNAASQAAAGVQRNTYTGDNSTATFTLPSAPWADAVVFAYLDGLMQDDSEWSVAGDNITFNTAPGTGVNIELVVLTAGTVTAAQANASNAAISAAEAAASAASAAAAANEVGQVSDYTALKALAAGGLGVVSVKAAARGGMFTWRSGDQSANITADPSEGIYVPPSSDVTGASGAWARNVADGRYNGKWFGIVADGSTDIAAKLQDAIDLADTNSIGAVFLPRDANAYAWNAQVTGAEGVAIELYGDYLMGTAANTPAYFVSGSEGSAVSVTATATKGDTSVTVGAGDESGFTAGGWARIYATDVIDSQRTSTKVAELVRVESTSSGSIVLDQSLEFTYATSPSIVPVTLVQSPVLRGDFKVYATGAADNDLYFCRFLLCESVYCSGFDAERIDDRAVGVEDCAGALIENWTCKNTETSSTGYGVSIIGCSKGVRIFNWEASDVRHAISTNNSSGRGGAPEVRAGFGDIFGSPLTNPGGVATSPLDTHAACTSVHYHDITIYGSSGDAVNIEAANVICERLKVIGSGAAGIRVLHYSDQPGHFTFRDIEVNGAAEEALSVRPVSGAGTLHRVHIDGFKAFNCNGSGQNLFEIGFIAANPIEEVVIKNVFISDCANVTGQALYIDEVSRVSIDNIRIDEYDNTGLRLRDIDYCDVNGYVFSAGSGSCEGMYLDDNLDNFYLRNSLIDGRSLGGADGILVDSLVQLAVIEPSVIFLNNTADITGSSSIPIRGYVDKDGDQVLGERGAAVSNTTITFTANDPSITPDDAVTIADGAAPTGSELLELCIELKNQIETLKARLDDTGHGLIAS